MKNKSFPWVATPLAIAISGFAAGNALASATTDTSFGTNGIASLNFNNLGVLYPNTQDYVKYPEPVPIIGRQPVVELNNGDIVSFASRYEEAGSATKSGYNYCSWSSCYMVYQSSGALVSGSSKTRLSRFSASGAPISTIDIGGMLAVSALVQLDGKLLLMGNDLVRGPGSWNYISKGGIQTAKPTMTSQIVLMRFNANGTPDTSFDGDGTLYMGPPGIRQAKGLALMADGKITVLSVDFNFTASNPHLWRFNSDGSIDTSFGGGDGNLPLSIPNAWALLKQEDDKLLVRYRDANNQAYARFDTEGVLDSGFAGDGTLNIGKSFYWAAPMLQQADGKLLLAADHVYRYDLTGAHEQTFTITAYTPKNIVSLTETAWGDVLVARSDGSARDKIDVFYSNGTKNTTVYLDQLISRKTYSSYSSDTTPFNSIGEILLQSNGHLLASGRDGGTGSATLNRYINFNLSGGDGDSDVVADPVDNCPVVYNPDQLDTDTDSSGDACDTDDDNDGVVDASDKLPLNISASSDPDSDGSPNSWNVSCDVICQSNSGWVLDNCPSITNPDQMNSDNDTQGNACDADDDNDGVVDASDNCSFVSNINQLNSDGDVFGDACDIDPNKIYSAGSLDNSFNPGVGPNNGIPLMALQPDGKGVIGGSFTTVNGVIRNRIARLHDDGSLDNSFNPGLGPNNSVYAMQLQEDGKVIIGGAFTAVNGAAHSSIARLHPDGSVDSSISLVNINVTDVNNIVVQSDGKIVFSNNGYFLGGRDWVPFSDLYRLNSNGSFDQGFVDPGALDITDTMAIRADDSLIMDGEFIVQIIPNQGPLMDNVVVRYRNDGPYSSVGIGNQFSSFRTTALQPDGRILIASMDTLKRLNDDDSIDNSFNSGGSTIDSIAVQADGKILIGGSFTKRIARLNADGSWDSSFNPGSGANGSVSHIDVQADGKIVIGGYFTTVNGVVRNYIARIHSGDSDYDGIEDAADQFPNDTDNDGLTNDIDTDDDNDLMPDVWEIQYGLNPLTNDANGDADNDGVTNLREYTNGSNPTAAKTNNDYNSDGIAGWIWKGQSNGVETKSQIWQLTFPLLSENFGVPNRFYPPPFPDQANWDMVTSGDFNNDGDADILWRNNTTAQWKVWQMQNGTRVAQNAPADFDLAHEWQVAGAGDTDQDGDDDIIFNHAATGDVVIWEMQNHAVAATHSVGTREGYLVNRIGDFNRDGDVDLLLRQTGGDALFIWELQANSFVMERWLAMTGAGFNPVCTGDFDNDGDDDLMLTSVANNQHKWFVLEDFARLSQKFSSTNIGFVFKGCGDYDGDGDADSLWQRSSDDANRVVLQHNFDSFKQTVYTNAFGGVNPGAAGYGFIYRGNSN